MKRQITCLLAVCMLSALLCGCGRSEKQTAGTKPTAPVQTAAATETPIKEVPPHTPNFAYARCGAASSS